MNETALELVPQAEFVVRHRLSGRVRIYTPGLRGSEALARGIRKELCEAYGVKQVVASPQSGTVLIVFDEDTCSIDSLMRQVRTSCPQAGEPDDSGDSWMTQGARTIKHLAKSADNSLQQSTDGKLDLKKVVLSSLFARALLAVMQTGPQSWDAVEKVAEFAIAVCLYENPKAQQEVKEAEDVASPE